MCTHVLPDLELRMMRDYYTLIMIKHVYAPYWVCWLEVQQLLASDLALQTCVTYNILLHCNKVELEAAKHCTHFRMNACVEIINICSMRSLLLYPVSFSLLFPLNTRYRVYKTSPAQPTVGVLGTTVETHPWQLSGYITSNVLNFCTHKQYLT